MLKFNQAYIGGRFKTLHHADISVTFNPVTGEEFAQTVMANRDDVKHAIAEASMAQAMLDVSSTADRINMLKQLEQAILGHSGSICAAIVAEYGGPVSRAKWISDYAANCFANMAKVLQDYPFKRRIGASEVIMQGVGVAGLVVPWNSTIGTICSKLSCALAAGCASIIKPSELSPLQTLVIAEALHSAGLPSGVFNILIGRGNEVGEEISQNPGIAKISFTGSTATGKLISKMSTDSMKRVSLALSGKSAAIVLHDADFPDAIAKCVQSAFQNNGQACIAGTRVLVPRNRLEETIDLVRLYVSQVTIGDPADPTTEMGPLACLSQYNRMQEYIQIGLAEGATLVIGGQGRPEGYAGGYFVRPTVFAQVTNEMQIARDEIFCPILCIMTYDSTEHAVNIANDSVFGLNAYLYGKNVEHAQKIASRLKVGSVLINRVMTELSAPFGGMKQSGIGREFGVYGLESYLEAKAIVI